MDTLIPLISFFAIANCAVATATYASQRPNTEKSDIIYNNTLKVSALISFLVLLSP